MDYPYSKARIINVLLVVILVFLVGLFGALMIMLRSINDHKSTTDAEGTQPQPSLEYTTESNDRDSMDEIWFDTLYCRLYFPSEWEGSMHTEIVEAEDSYAVAFWGQLENKKELLFTVYFGDAPDDVISVGYLVTEESGRVAVSIEMSDFMPGNDWTQEESDTMCAMQESVNHMIARLEEEPAYRSK